MKQCTHCRELKPETEFWHRKHEPDGLARICIPCQKTTSLKSRDKHRLEIRRTARKYYAIRKANGAGCDSTSPTNATRAYYRRNPDLFRAKAAVKAAIDRTAQWLSGKAVSGPLIIRPLFCSACGCPASRNRIIAHHFNGYTDPEDQIRSIYFVCSKCHTRIHVLLREAALMGRSPVDGFKRFLDEAWGRA